MVNYVWQVSKKLRRVCHRLNSKFLSCAEAKIIFIGVRFASSAYETTLLILWRQFNIDCSQRNLLYKCIFMGFASSTYGATQDLNEFDLQRW